MNKVNKQVLEAWMIKELEKYLPDDEIVIGFAIEMIQVQYPDIGNFEQHMSGFLGKDTRPFCSKLWTLALSAQNDPDGIPKELVEERRRELQRTREDRQTRDRRRIGPTSKCEPRG